VLRPESARKVEFVVIIILEMNLGAAKVGLEQLEEIWKFVPESGRRQFGLNSRAIWDRYASASRRCRWLEFETRRLQVAEDQAFARFNMAYQRRMEMQGKLGWAYLGYWAWDL